MKSSCFENAYGIGGDESKQSSNLRKSMVFSNKSHARIRSSIAGKFFQKREGSGSAVLPSQQETPTLGQHMDSDQKQ